MNSIGLSLLFDPIGFEAGADLELPNDARLLSELRAQGAGLTLGGVFMLAGAARERFARQALALSAPLYTAYGLARIVGLVLDGQPGETFLKVAALEVVLGVGAIMLFAIPHARPHNLEFERSSRVQLTRQEGLQQTIEITS